MIEYTKEEALELSKDFLNTILGDSPSSTHIDNVLGAMLKQAIIRMFDEWLSCDVIRDQYSFGEYLVKCGF